MIGSWQGFSLALMNFLRIPPGVGVRKSNGDERSRGSENLASFEFIDTIVDITADDVCIGRSPVYCENLDSLHSPILQAKYRAIVNALNGVIKWAAVDVLKRGVSLYCLVEKGEGEVRARARKVSLIPIMTQKAKFYLNNKGEVVVEVGGKVRDDLLVFLNYSKETLRPISEEASRGLSKDYLYEIEPEPVQLKHVEGIAQDLYMIERAMYRYRVQLSRVVRFAEVEVGLSQGDRVDEIISDVSGVVNANSMSLGMMSVDPQSNFDDNIPVNPVRKGAGSIEMKSDIPDFSMMKEMPDLEYALNRVFLALRFPRTYSDFNTALNETAVSLIRGDIRYSRMVSDARSLLQTTINEWVGRGSGEDEVEFKLTSLPTSESDDVIEALGSYASFTQDVFAFINEAEDKNEAFARLDSIVILLGDTSNLKAIQSWIVHMRSYITDKFDKEEREGSSLEEDESSEPDAGFEFGDEEVSEGGVSRRIASGGGSTGGESVSPESIGLPPFNE